MNKQDLESVKHEIRVQLGVQVERKIDSQTE